MEQGLQVLFKQERWSEKNCGQLRQQDDDSSMVSGKWNF